MEVKKPPARWPWIPEAMPLAYRQIEELRARWGAAYVNDCIMRGMAGEPGRFFARERAVAVGTPWDDPVMANFAALQVTATQALVVLPAPPGSAP